MLALHCMGCIVVSRLTVHAHGTPSIVLTCTQVGSSPTWHKGTAADAVPHVHDQVSAQPRNVEAVIRAAEPPVSVERRAREAAALIEALRCAGVVRPQLRSCSAFAVSAGGRVRSVGSRAQGLRVRGGELL